MSKLHFFYGPMGAGKSTLALQLAYNLRAQGQTVQLFTGASREEGKISSRLGPSEDAIDLDGIDYTIDLMCEGLDAAIVDEAQFCYAEEIDRFAELDDDYDIDVYAFGLLTDFQGNLFPGSKRLLELADEISLLQLPVLCWCGNNGTLNARIVDGQVVKVGEQVLVGDTAGDSPGYRVLCRQHWRQGRMG